MGRRPLTWRISRSTIESPRSDARTISFKSSKSSRDTTCQVEFDSADGGSVQKPEEVAHESTASGMIVLLAYRYAPAHKATDTSAG